ncbi:MAG: hypothetical protein ACI9TV_002554 [Sulfurimonas sp.]
MNSNIQFSSDRKPEKLQKIIFNQYFYNKQTLKQLSSKYKRSIPWVRKQIYEYEPTYNTFIPRAVTIVADATFFGKRKDKFGVLVFKDVLTNRILIWKHIESEKLIEYIYLKDELISKGFTINGITVDGKRGLFRALEEFPVQMCHFHQKIIIHRYLTRRPKLEASKELKKIVSRLTTTTELRSKNKLDKWNEVHNEFINEKSINSITGKNNLHIENLYRHIEVYKRIYHTYLYIELLQSYKFQIQLMN